MADYREITQDYAKGAIKTVILVNAGGIIATLNQLEEITKFASTNSLKWAMAIWVFGIVFGVAAWACGYVSTVNYGNFDEFKNSSENVNEANGYHNSGGSFARYTAITIFLSLLSFVLGCLLIIFCN